jgi:anti-sigma-K factor RskA
MGVDHPLGDQAELYVLGALTDAERAEFEAHLAVCPACAAEVRALAPVVTGLAATATGSAPSPGVRDRVLATIARRGAPAGYSRSGWFAAAASIVFATVFGTSALHLRDRVSTLEAELRDARLRAEANEQRVADLRRAADGVTSMLAVMLAPDVARVELAGQPAAPSASARAFWSRSRGLVINATNLPPLPAGRTYQLWVLTAQPSPISAGLLRPDANGRASAMFNTPPDIPQPTAMAVTIEPEGGVPSPTGDKYLVGVAH